MRTTSELYQLLLDVEQLVDTRELLLEGRNVWPILRVYTANRLIDEHPEPISRSRQPRWFGRWQERQRQIDLDKADSGFQSLRQADFVTLGYDAHRTEEFSGKPFNPHLDPLHFLFEPNNGLHLEVAFSSERMGNSFSVPTVSLLSRLHRYRLEKGSSRKHWAPAIFQWCHKMEEVFRDSYFHSENVSLWVDMVISSEAMFDDVFDEIRPNALFVAGFYDPIFFGAVRMAKSKGIATVDVQHEPLLEQHFGYHGWKNADEKSYDYIPDNLWHWNTHVMQAQERSFQKEKVRHWLTGVPFESFGRSQRGDVAEQIRWQGMYSDLIGASLPG